MKLICDIELLRPTDNDRYVRNAPENPKKVREFPEHSVGELIYCFQTLFHYDGMYYEVKINKPPSSFLFPASEL